MPCSRCDVAELLIGYGMIGTWDGQGVALGNPMAAAGLNYTEVEMNAGPIATGEHLRTAAGSGADLTAFVTAMRARGIVTAILLANWNGPEVRAQSDGWLQAWIDVIVAMGPQLIAVEAVTEPDNANTKAVRWQQMVQTQLGGTFVVMANGAGGRGEPIIPGWTLKDWHWCEDWEQSTIKPPRASNTTDCTPMLDLTPSHAASLIAHAVAARAYALIYGLNDLTPNLGVISAIGGVLPPEGLTFPPFIITGIVPPSTAGRAPQII